jgi:hypothetical protein
MYFQYLAVQAWKSEEEGYLERSGQLKMNPILTKEILELYQKSSDAESIKILPFYENLVTFVL